MITGRGVGPRAKRRRKMIAEYEARHGSYVIRSNMSQSDWAKYMTWRLGYARVVMNIGLTTRLTR